MSIVHHVPDFPKDGQVVYADNGKYSSDRAIFKNGSFMGGGDFPVASYRMSYVSKWFCLEEYDKIKGGGSYGISFDDAEEMNQLMLSN